MGAKERRRKKKLNCEKRDFLVLFPALLFDGTYFMTCTFTGL